MNKSQRIYLGTGNTSNVGLDMHINIKLEQDVNTLEILTMKLDVDEVYQNFNSDYGVLIGRVIANGGVGIPNAKISIFIPLTDTDANDGEIASIYPYTTPRDKNSDGKRYNLLPRVSQYNSSVGTYKPVQPFGSFLIKPELVTNQPFLDVYKKYYKYTALTNDNGDYMIFGVPVGTQTVHMSVDITDIGKYSMSPQSMINAGYPANLFTDNGSRIKGSSDLTDLPNIETQEVTVDIIPFWGDATDFEIGITRQDFRIRAVVQSSFVIFGTSMTMGKFAMFGNPQANKTNIGFYAMTTTPQNGIENNIDVRVNRVAPIDIRVFTIAPDSPNTSIDSKGKLHLLSGFDCDNDIIELSSSDYYKYADLNGNFALNIPCNQVKIITDDLGGKKIVNNNSTTGVFSMFFGMVLARYPDVDNLQINPLTPSSYSFENDHTAYAARGWFKIPQSIGLVADNDVLISNREQINENWRKEFYSFSGNTIYSIAQFFPTKNPLVYKEHADTVKTENTFGNTINTEGHTYVMEKTTQGGAWFKVGGSDGIDTSVQNNYDKDNYIIPPTLDIVPLYKYDFSPNVTKFSNQPSYDTYFGGQWLNFCLMFPQYGVAYHAKGYPDRDFEMGDVYHNSYKYYSNHNIGTYYGEFFMLDNDQKIFAGLTNTKNLLKGDSFMTNFIVVPREELEKLNLIDAKGINVRRFNSDITTNPNTILLSAKTYQYLKKKQLIETTTGREYDRFGWDDYADTYVNIPSDEPATAYLFKGMYGNDCIKLVFGLNLV